MKRCLLTFSMVKWLNYFVYKREHLGRMECRNTLKRFFYGRNYSSYCFNDKEKIGNKFDISKNPNNQS